MEDQMEGLDSESATQNLASSDVLYRQLRADILADRFRDEEHLAEATIAKQYGVSRTPVREALRRLEGDDLLFRDGARFRVRVLSEQEINDLYEVRSMLEGNASRLAARRATEFDLSRVAGRNAQMSRYGGDDPQEMKRLNQGFHVSVWEASHNAVLVNSLRRIYLTGSRYTTLTIPDRWETCIEEHERIVSSIRDGDPDAAFEAMDEHVENGRELFLRALASIG